MKKLYLYILIAIVVLGTAGYFVFSGTAAKAVKYRTEKANRGSIILTVRATGTVNPVRTVEVGSQVSGTIAKLFVDYNSVVKKGQIVAIIDSTFLYSSVKVAQANVDRANASLSNSKRVFERDQDLIKHSLISQADLDAAQATYEADAATVKQTQATFDGTMTNLRYAVIRAPIDGVVIERDVDVGQTVAASLQAPKLFVIAEDLQNMQVEASVDEADIGQIRDGEPVSFTVDAYPDDPFRGRVSQIRLAPVTVQNVVTYTVIIDVPNPDLKLRPGMTATVSMLVDRRDNAIRIPALALRFQPSQELKDKFADQLAAGSPQHTQQQAAAPAQGTDTARHRMQGAMGANGQSHHGAADGGQWQHTQKGTVEPGSAAAATPPKLSRIWILDAAGNPKPVQVQLGLNDNRYVEAIGDQIKEGDDVILSMNGVENSVASAQQQNPFMPRMGGPAGGGRGR